MPHLFYRLDLQPYTWTRFSRVPGPIFSVLLACLGRNIHYDRVEREDYEFFTLEDARLCDATSMEVFLEDWDSFSGQLCQAMENMAWALRHLEQKNEEES